MTITGPFITTRSSVTERYTQHKYKWVGNGPRKPMPYFVGEVRQGGTSTWAIGQIDGINSVAATDASNLITSGKLYDKFFSRLGPKAEGMMNLYEGRKTWSMVALRAGMLLSAARSLIKGRPAEAVRALGLTRHPKSAAFVRKWKGNTRQTSKAWLEFTFGWAPIASDMQSAVKVFEQEFSTRIRVSIRDDRTFVHAGISWDPGLDRLYGVSYYSSHQIKATASAWFKIDNPNLFLANRLGFVNLGSVLWDAIPFSFVLDWFGKFGTYVRSLTDSVGITFVDAYRGWSTKGTGSYIDCLQPSTRTGSWSAKGGGRTLGLPPRPDPFDRLRMPNFDPWLAITSLSLLVVTLTGMTKRT